MMNWSNDGRRSRDVTCEGESLLAAERRVRNRQRIAAESGAGGPLAHSAQGEVQAGSSATTSEGTSTSGATEMGAATTITATASIADDTDTDAAAAAGTLALLSSTDTAATIVPQLHTENSFNKARKSKR